MKFNGENKKKLQVERTGAALNNRVTGFSRLHATFRQVSALGIHEGTGWKLDVSFWTNPSLKMIVPRGRCKSPHLIHDRPLLANHPASWTAHLQPRRDTGYIFTVPTRCYLILFIGADRLRRSYLTCSIMGTCVVYL